VCNVRSAQLFGSSLGAAIGRFARRGFHFQNGAVTVPSRNDGDFSLILSERA
jgi:hypothetical protein